MNIRICFTIAALAVSGWLFAQPLRAEPPPQAPPKGHVLVLDNDRTLDGDIERVGEQYRIRREAGETWVPVTKGSQLCDDFEDAYKLLRRRSNPDDADEHMKLAHWCHQHELKAQALAEVRLVIAIRPDSDDGKRLLAMLDRGAASPSVRNTTPQPASAEIPCVFPLVDVEPDCFTQFITRIQPILMNACVSCHGSQHAGAFKLLRVSSEGIMSRRSTQQNLSTVLAHVNLQNPELSPVLMKARLPHGDQATAALNCKGPQSAAMQALQDWVKDTVAKNPLLPQQLGSSACSVTIPETRPTVAASKASGEGTFATEARASGEPPTAVAVKASEPVKATPTTAGPAMPTVADPHKGMVVAEVKAQQVSPSTAPADEFDAAIFNRQFHPAKK